MQYHKHLLQDTDKKCIKRVGLLFFITICVLNKDIERLSAGGERTDAGMYCFIHLREGANKAVMQELMASAKNCIPQFAHCSLQVPALSTGKFHFVRFTKPKAAYKSYRRNEIKVI